MGCRCSLHIAALLLCWPRLRSPRRRIQFRGDAVITDMADGSIEVSAAQAAQLEREIARAAGPQRTTKLIAYYIYNATQEKAEPHIEWVVENHPASEFVDRDLCTALVRNTRTRTCGANGNCGCVRPQSIVQSSGTRERCAVYRPDRCESSRATSEPGDRTGSTEFALGRTISDLVHGRHSTATYSRAGVTPPFISPGGHLILQSRTG